MKPDADGMYRLEFLLGEVDLRTGETIYRQRDLDRLARQADVSKARIAELEEALREIRDVPYLSYTAETGEKWNVRDFARKALGEET